MSVGLLLICHNAIGETMAATATELLSGQPLPLRVVNVYHDNDPEQVIEQARALVKEIDSGEGILILSDLFGATPCNIARRLQPEHRIAVVTGLNLPMLIRTLNYPELGLEELADKARSGGVDGIVLSDDRE